MARTNRFGETVDILLEGSAPAIAYDPDKRAICPYAESTVWGNMFDSTVAIDPQAHTTSPQPFAAYVCRNYGTGLCPDAALRACDEGSACGFIDMGDCTNPAVLCSGALGTPPSSCNAYDNKIRVFLKTVDDVCPANFGTYSPL